MINIEINNIKFLVKEGISVLEACKYIGITVPRFCYHETLSIPANCRMCLVELEGSEKPVASCATEALENMIILTDSPFVKKARENVVESLLLNHPLDCPICDQAGECDLQDQTKSFGSDYSRFFFNKRGVEDKDCGPLIKTIMTRCIHCTRCVRFGSEVAGLDFLGTLNRGTSTEIGGYVSNFFNSEISGNVIDLCPVGALTSKPFAFKARPWELRLNESVDVTDSTGSNIYVNFKESEIFRILPKSNLNINEHLISDKSRFYYDSNNHNRIKNIFKFYSKNDKFKLSKWTSFFNEIYFGVTSAKSFSIIVSENIDILSLSVLKKIKSLNKNIKLFSSSKIFYNDDNVNLFGLSNHIKDINNATSICLVLMLNPKTECSLLNARLRTQTKNSLLSTLSFGQFMYSNTNPNFVFLNIENFIPIFEGKMLKYSRLLITSKEPLILLGTSIYTKISKISYFIAFLKSINNSLKFLNIGLYSNTEGVKFLGLNTMDSRSLSNSSYLMSIDLDDVFNVRKYLLRLSNHILLWLNSHGSKMALNAKMIIPTLTEFEEERLLINLEQRPQKTYKTFSNFSDSRSVKDILIASFEITNFKENVSINYLNFLHEISSNPNFFNLLNKKFVPNLSFEMNKLNACSYVTKSFGKLLVEDFYLTTKSTKNSLVMQESSKTLKKISSNFVSLS